MPDDSCRIGKLEVEVINLKKEIVEFNEKHDTVLELLQDIKQTNARQQGFIGGVVFVVGGMMAVATFVINKYF